ncbi:sugar transferase [Patescibacteria group bacterium]|nr:sugar transferase [Patescibacteria group bacterium]MBU1500706.1 sugar transferase [Patescibacteria group bacterium]MBU2080976.1 sugar transferase [Patescibacteria group bacterium]MBU2124244.1 sugar transferase [Patescibacteria group bacterium]MBU2195037.1 sugar transferase [Patescibacteria group bacterium]
MIYGRRRAPALLFIGDIAVFAASLYVTLILRAGALPRMDSVEDHIGPFAILFIIWTIVFYMSGLYGKGTVLFKSHQPQALVRTQIANIILAALFFFLVPGVGIAPKTTLVIYLGVSLVFIFIWRLAVYPRISIRRSRASAVLIAEGAEAAELAEEVNSNPRYHIAFSKAYTPEEFLEFPPEKRQVSLPKGLEVVVADMAACDARGLLPALYDLPHAAKGYEIIDFSDLYEEVFDRIPLSLLDQGWFLENVTTEDSLWYTIPKRLIDIIGGLLMGLVTVVALPFVWLALRTEGPGPLFISQDRYGERGSRIKVYKFRSMRGVEEGAWKEESENTVTRVGSILRQTSLDEFPQFINVLKGEVSLIGPRNDVVALGKRLAEALPHYNMRYSVKPGITGWAQINQQYEQGNMSPQSVRETTVRLAYDFYYLKHRSLGLDLVIALKTVKRMLFRLSAW